MSTPGVARDLPTVSVRSCDLECRLVQPNNDARTRPPLVFLHDGLGSADLWRDFPDVIRETAGNPGMLVYSRSGHGRSSSPSRPRADDYMHREALDVLPELLERFELSAPVLIGHSDGASIALIHAGAGHRVSGLVLLSPHVFVEGVTLDGIRETRRRFDTDAEWRERLRRHHHDAGQLFSDWSTTWLDPGFRSWQITELVGQVDAPVLVLQGSDDPYGTPAHAASIERRAAGPVRTLILEGVGHAPHIEARDAVVANITSFVLDECRI
jgi:pimeloyl-ACP methyl ester carboxylesterase